MSFLQEALRKHDPKYVRHGFLTSPIALEFARQRHPADRLATRLNDTFQAGPMRFD